MRKRLLLILGCLGLVLLTGYLTLRLTAPRHQITLDDIEAIEEGMTEKEVEVILGAPTGTYSSVKNTDIENLLPPCYDKPGDKFWVSEKFCVGVRFDETGKVARFDSFNHRYQNKSFLAKLRRWLGM